MSKTSKKLFSLALSLILAIGILAGLSVTAAAEWKVETTGPYHGTENNTAGKYGAFSSTYYYFNGDDTMTTSGTTYPASLENPWFKADGLGGGETGTTIEKGTSTDGTPCLVIDKKSTTKGVSLLTMNGGSKNHATNLHIEFSIYLSATPSDFTMNLRGYNQNTDKQWYKVLGFNNGYVSLCENPVYKIDNEKWYDVKAKFDTTTKAATLQVRPSGIDNDGKVVSWENCETFKGIIPKMIISPTDIKTIVDFYEIRFRFTDSKAYTVKLTDYMQNTCDTIPLSLDSLSDNFETLPVASADENVNVCNSQTGWVGAVESDDVDVKLDNGKLTYTIQGSTEAPKYTSLTKTAFLNPSGTYKNRHRIRMTTTSPGKHDGLNWILVFPAANYYPIKISADTLTMFDKVVEGASFTQGETLELEILYDDENKLLIGSVTDEDGNQYIANGSEWMTTNFENADWGYIKGINFQHQTPKRNETYSISFSDFRWDIQDSAVVGSAAIKHTDDDDASLDETAVFTFDATLDYDATPTVAVAKDGVAVPAENYTVSKENDKLIVKFDELEKGQPYTVTVSNVATLVSTDTKAAELTKSFTTTSKGLTIGDADQTGTVSIESGYANKPLVLLAALYDGTGKLVEVNKAESVIDRSTNTASVSASFTKNAGEGSYVKVFAWSTLGEMKPYRAEKKLD